MAASSSPPPPAGVRLWTCTATYGTVSGSGLNTAPSTVSQVAVGTAAATGQQSGDAAAALVTIVPQGAQVSPAYTLMQPTTPPQQFSAALSGAPNQEVTWSMTPQVGKAEPSGPVHATQQRVGAAGGDRHRH